ncbi:hypothetical protein BDN67DRAFT_900701 [Paxillus ammoniavirescens]|nr:hypothetical protein BDN67DRAFT_900701 [Paxillus ammoniavirescens]
MSPSITVLYFAAASTATGIYEEVIELPNSEPLPLSSLGAHLVSLRPQSGLGEVLKTSQWSVNAEMVSAEDADAVLLRGGEEVAVICPVSGG